MTCTIGAPAPTPISGGLPPGPTSVAPGSGGGPTAALDGAVAGTQGGAVSSLGGGGAAIAGAAGVVGVEQLVPIIQQLTAVITQLATAMQPVAGGGAATIPGIAAAGAPAVGSTMTPAPTTSNTIPGVGTAGGGVTLEPPSAGTVIPASNPQVAGASAPVTGGGAPAPAAAASGCGCGGGTTANPVQSGPPGKADKPEKAGRSKKADKGNKAQGANGAPTAAPVSGDVSKWLTGDTAGVDADLLGRLATLGERLGQKLDVISGNRTFEEQTALYAKYKAGTGNLAAKPGTSNHEHGDAADVNVGGASLANNAKAEQLAAELGLHFPVPGEPWHVEVK